MITLQLLDNTQISGRLGNNLFQIATALATAKRYGVECILPPWKYQQYFPKLKFRDDVLDCFCKIYVETSRYFSEINIDHTQDWTLNGYFQSYRYFDWCKDYIKEMLTPVTETNDLGVENVSIHVRRGDYLSLNHIHPVQDMDYYNKAMTLFPGREFSIFSDDIQWCMDNFNHDTCTFVMPTDAILDFNYMLEHKDHIIANSSFSYWAAYLGGGKVVAPKVWVRNEDRDERIPVDWIKL